MSARLLRPRAAGGFNPKSISGLIGWWDASDSSRITPASAPLANAGTITTWADKSGLGQSLAQSNAVNRPTYAASSVGGRPAIAFAESGSQYMTGVFSQALTGMSSYVVAIVNGGSRVVSLQVGSNILDFQGTNWMVRLKRSSSTQLSVPYDPSDDRVQRPYTEGTAFISSMFHVGSTLSHRVNNGTAATAAAAMNTTYGHLTLSSINRTAYNGGFTGSISEILFYNRSISSSENAAIVSYLSKKYGITVS
jgi:hypothetical protein